jgi:hypothetical protein
LLVAPSRSNIATSTLRQPPCTQLHRVLDELTARILAAEICVQVDVGRLAAFATHQLIDRHTGLATLDVPERIADATDSAVLDRVVLVIGAQVADLPDLLDAIGGAAHDQGLEVLLHGRCDQLRASARKCGRRAAIAVEPWLVGLDLHHGGIVDAATAHLNYAHIADPRGGHAAARTIDRALRLLLALSGGGLRHGILQHPRERRPAAQHRQAQQFAARERYLRRGAGRRGAPVTMFAHV